MRAFGATAAVLAVAAAAPAAATADESLQGSGSITYTWQGSPSLGCAAVGVCDVEGALVIDAQGNVDVQGVSHQTIINFNNNSATVRVLTGTGQSASECVDAAVNQPGLTVFVSRSGRGLVGAIEPGLSSGRCAGPLASDLRGLTLPVRRSPGKHPSFDLRTSRTFTAGPFAGTLVSTVTMQPTAGLGTSSSSSSGSFGSSPARRKVLIEHVRLRYRVTGRSEPLTVSFSGESDPFCAVLDSCGASGEVALSAPAFSGTLTLTGSRQIGRTADPQQVLTDVKRGRIALFGEVSSGLLTSETFVRADGSRCQDSAENVAALTVGGFPPFAPRTNAVLAETGAGVDALRTHCPGPATADVFPSNGQVALARGPINFAQLVSRHSTLSLSAQGGFSGLGYTGSRGGAIDFSLSLVGVRAGTSQVTQ